MNDKTFASLSITGDTSKLRELLKVFSPNIFYES